MAYFNKNTLLITATLISVGLSAGTGGACHATPRPCVVCVGFDSPTRSIDSGTPWRLTTEGWQDSSTWPVADAYVPRRIIEHLHPLVWSALVLVGTVATMIWASSEWEIARLFGKRAVGLR